MAISISDSPDTISRSVDYKLLAHDAYDELRHIASRQPGRETAAMLYRMLESFCLELTRELSFPSLFARLDYVCREAGLKGNQQFAIQRLRFRLHSGDAAHDSKADYQEDLALMADFIHQVCRVSAPSQWRLGPLSMLQHESHAAPRVYYDVLRIIVDRWDDTHIYAHADTDSPDAAEVTVDYAHAGYDGDLQYISTLLHKGMSANLIRAELSDDGILTPRLITLLPDYLLDVSTLAANYREYGHSPVNFILRRLEPRQDTPYTLLGNVAGQMLDDLIYATSDEPASYAASICKAFRQQPLAFSLLDINERFDFHQEARRQFDHLQTIINQQLEPLYGFDKDKALVEPSFVCEALGLSGRMDYLQSDYTKLVEQKSGKRDEYRHSHREPHFIQMMLYQLMLRYCVHADQSQVEPYLLYSRYADGLMREKTYVTLLRDVLATRNRIVVQEERCSEGAISDLLAATTPDSLNEAQSNGKLWTLYQRPALERLLSPFKPQDAGSPGELAQLYFYRYYTFLCREQLLAKTGADGDIGHSFADCWELPAAVRQANGDMYANLQLHALDESTPGEGRGYDLVTLDIPTTSLDTVTNFRLGDAVILYRYPAGSEPDIRHQLLMRGRLQTMTPTTLTVQLNHGQRNRQVLLPVEQGQPQRFALEHDHVESSAESLYRSLYTLLLTTSQRRSLILDQRPPVYDGQRLRRGEYGSFNELVDKLLRAQDYFLVIGPPGSGKTSCALRYMVEEELRQGSRRILLMAYTNRAVDELCNMLDALSAAQPALLPDYLRLGSPLAAEPQYRSHLLSQRSDVLDSKAAVQKLLDETHVYVATTTTMSGQDLLMQRLHFDVAFVDEASQILEPQLLKPLCILSDDGQPSVSRFVLVGDQKQLPAVVMQPMRDSRVNDQRLRQIGLEDCRNSLFQRLLILQQRAHRTEAWHLLSRQGRMHPDLFRFVNNAFYDHQLACVPIRHQQQSLSQLYPHSQHLNAAVSDACQRLIASRRIAFIDQSPADDGPNDKINSAEAATAARIVSAYAATLSREDRTLHAQDVGIIVPYRNQISMIRSALQAAGIDCAQDITIDTVERFQGSQRDLIIYSLTVRRPAQLAFLSSSTYLDTDSQGHPLPVDRKLNVALTRARLQLFIIGNARLLSRLPLYKALIDATLTDLYHL